MCRKRLSQLPDKGHKIKILYDKLISEIAARDEITQATSLFSKLNIVSKGIEVTFNMEWNKNRNVQQVRSIDHDNTESEPLKMLAQSRTKTTTVNDDASVTNSLITSMDLNEIKTFSIDAGTIEDSYDADLEPHALHVANYERHNSNHIRFLPHRTTTAANVYNTEKEKPTTLGIHHQEITAATPPMLRNSAVKMLSLQESIEVQRKQIQSVKVG